MVTWWAVNTSGEVALLVMALCSVVITVALVALTVALLWED